MPPVEGDGGTIDVNIPGYQAATGAPPPPVPTPDPALTAGLSPTDALVSALIAAANSGDPEDIKEVLRQHAERQLKTADAAQKFTANEAGGQDQMMQLAQSLPQMAGSLAGAIAGAVGGVIQPLAQVPQQLMQAGMGAMQTGMGMMESAAATEEFAPEDWAADEFGSDLDELGGGLDDVGGGGGPEGLGGTTPMSMLSPAATPTGSTTPTSGRVSVPTPPVTTAQPTGYTGGMGGYPMMPPGAMGGAAAGGKDEKVDTKRVSPPTVKNGAPVQGRIITPPAGPTVSKQVDGKPVVTKRIVVPNDKLAERMDLPEGRQGPERRT